MGRGKAAQGRAGKQAGKSTLPSSGSHLSPSLDLWAFSGSEAEMVKYSVCLLPGDFRNFQQVQQLCDLG